MKSIFVIGAATLEGQNLIRALGDEFNIVSDHCPFGLSESLRRGHLLDQIRRFGPFDAVLVCVGVHPSREIHYAVDLIPDILTLPWLALSALRELSSDQLSQYLFTINASTGLEQTLTDASSEQGLVSHILTTAHQYLLSYAGATADGVLHELSVDDDVLVCVRQVLGGGATPDVDALAQ